MNFRNLTFCLLSSLAAGLMAGTSQDINCHCQEVIDLAGQWRFAFDSAQYNRMVTLPGTTDTNKLGKPCADTHETSRLSRLRSYCGEAWYSTDFTIPESQAGWTLFLERTKYSRVYIDGGYVGSSNDISSPQVFSLPTLKAGSHKLEIMIDNGAGVPTQIFANSHACCEDTQTNWNGIIGRICLVPMMISADSLSIPADFISEVTTSIPSASQHPAFKDFHIEDHHFYADGHKVFLRGKHDACVWPLQAHVAMTLDEWLWYLGTCQTYGINHVRFHSWCPPEAAFEAADSLGIYLQPELPFWGDFNDKDSILMTFLHKEGLNILKWYGHHPSFRMMALGNELWGNIDQMKLFVDDFRAVAPDKLYTFGSNYYLGYQGVKEGMDYFTTCRVGGEAWGYYDTHTRGSFSYADVFDGGVLNHFRPSSSLTLEEGCSRSSVPVISHETGQFQIYPDYNEIAKYTGVLYPYNLLTFRERLANAGLLQQAEAFHQASGRWSAQLYKADIELDLRTPDMAGFQLLDLQDYPGQGSAYVGILDAFMDNKGICSLEEWRQWCAPVVPLFVADSLCFTSDGGLDGLIQVANYGDCSLAGRTLLWQLKAGEKTLAQGSVEITTDTIGLFTAGRLHADLSHLRYPTRMDLTLAIDGTEARNSYPLWSYPSCRQEDSWIATHTKDVIRCNALTPEVLSQLQLGAKVLFTPTIHDLSLTPDGALHPDSVIAEGAEELLGANSYNTVGPLFMTDYWNYRMFRTVCQNNHKSVSPGTLGILTDPSLHLFDGFPTDSYTSWQWFPVLHNSHPLILDQWPSDYLPQVQVIDNIERNHKLGLVMECKVGQGRLVIVMSDLDEASRYPEGKAFLGSVLDYMNSEYFQPRYSFSAENLIRLLSSSTEEVRMNELNNISGY